MTKLTTEQQLSKSDNITINRNPQRSRFTIISNDIIHNKELSLQAKGLLLTILSLPDDWVLYKSTIHRFSSSGKSATSTAWNELVKAGHIQSERIMNGNLVVGWKHIVFELPIDSRMSENRISENQSLLNTNTTNTQKTINTPDDFQLSGSNVPDYYTLHLYINQLRKEHNHRELEFTTGRSELYARLFKMKFSLEDLKLIARYRFNQLGSPEYRQYQVPETVFRFKGLQGWLDEAKAWDKPNNSSRLFTIA